ncbi:hypothetical protein [Arundinibacter roseus]|uniref:Uncharacterized protein n=1 Tax=Arundinibacter roseus TaxID=2070510 RepID=A0A4R4KIA2_9BACT|nr:hypothetical protein [Arundinibacter roseus]TDB67874.1 hypothetical protein EZE20_02820 [Arundinibacter roseus]
MKSFGYKKIAQRSFASNPSFDESRNHYLEGSLRKKVEAVLQKQWINEWSSFGPSYATVTQKTKFYEALSNTLLVVYHARYPNTSAGERTISRDTVRRFLLDNYTGKFYEQNKDLFAVFAGYDSWKDFVDKSSASSIPPPPVEVATEEIPAPPLPIPTESKSQNWIWGLLAVTWFLASLTAYFFVRPDQAPSVNSNAPVLSQINLRIVSASNAQKAPSLIKFAYDLGENSYDSAFINFGDGKKILSSPSGTVSQLFFHPKVTLAHIRIVKNGKNFVKSFQIPIKTDHWQAQIGKSLFFPADKIIQGNTLHLPLSQLPFQTIKEDFYTQYSYVQPFTCSMDTMVFEARIKNPMKEGGISCFDSEIALIGNSENKLSSLAFNLLHPSCIQYGYLKIADTQVGYDHANQQLGKLLPALGVDLSDWITVKVVCKNKVAELYVNEKLRHRQPYEGQIGELQAISLQFKGTGFVDWVQLRTLAGDIHYTEDFGGSALQ